MRSWVKGAAAVVLLAAAYLGGRNARAEIVEEIVAKVDDDIITKADLEQEEQSTLAEIYRTHTGAELDEQVRLARQGLLRSLIEHMILVHRARHLYDMDKMGDALLRSFKEQQRIKSDDELKRLLDQEGMTTADLKKRLIEMYAPQEILGFEVRDRISVADKEVDAYYQSHPEEFDVPAEVTVREIVLLTQEANKEARRAEAEKVRQLCAAPGADFAALARQYSEAGTKEGGGRLGPLKQGDLSEVLAKFAFSLPVGEVSPVIETAYGFHILKVESRSEARRKPLEEVRDDIRKRIDDGKFKSALADFLKKAWSEAEVWISPKYAGRLSPGPGKP